MGGLILWMSGRFLWMGSLPQRPEAGLVRPGGGFCAGAVEHQALGHYGACGGVGAVIDVSVERRQFDGGMDGRGGGTADQQGCCHPASGHLPAEFFHLI